MWSIRSPIKIYIYIYIYHRDKKNAFATRVLSATSCSSWYLSKNQSSKVQQNKTLLARPNSQVIFEDMLHSECCDCSERFCPWPLKSSALGPNEFACLRLRSSKQHLFWFGSAEICKDSINFSAWQARAVAAMAVDFGHSCGRSCFQATF